MSRDQYHASSSRHQDNSNAQTFVCNHHNNSHSATSSLFNITHVSLAAHVPFPQKFICTRPGEDPEDPEFTICRSLTLFSAEGQE